MKELRLRRVENPFGVAALGVASKAGEKIAVARLPDGRGLELRHVDERLV